MIRKKYTRLMLLMDRGMRHARVPLLIYSAIISSMAFLKLMNWLYWYTVIPITVFGILLIGIIGRWDIKTDFIRAENELTAEYNPAIQEILFHVRKLK